VFGQYIAVMGCVEDGIVECFRHGGGVPYEKCSRFHEVMADDSGQSVLSSLESHILPFAPGRTGPLAEGIRVLDAGCGRGRSLTRLAERSPRSRFVGMDLSPEATGYASGQAAKVGLTNVEFVAVDLSAFDPTAEPARGRSPTIAASSVEGATRAGEASACCIQPNSFSLAASEIATTAGCLRRRSTEMA
jgi:SAM-dependent methyltransferase